MRNKKMKKFTAVAAALTVATATLISGIGATLTAKEVSWTAEKPSGSPVLASLNKDMADGSSFTITADGANGWLSSNSSVATVSSGTVTLNAPGMVQIVRGTVQGELSSNTYLITDSSKPASYKITKNQSNLKTAGDTDMIPITMKDGNDKSITRQILWTSDDASVATVNETNGTITAVAKTGVANITGKFTDMYGQSQDIHYAAVVGDNVENTQIGPDDNGDYFKSTGDQDVYEKVDKDGNSKNPPEYIYDSDHNMNDGSKPNGDEQKLTPITDSMKNTVPSAEEFDNTKEGYLTDDEKNAYEKAVKNAENTGIVKDDNGKYYKSVGGGVWQEVTFNPATGAVTKQDPEVFVGGTTKNPSPYIPLYEIISPTDTTLSKINAEDYDNTYPGYLTNATDDANSEYAKWQAAKLVMDPDNTEWVVLKTTIRGGKNYALVVTKYLQDETTFGIDNTYSGSTLENKIKTWSESHVYNSATGIKYSIEADNGVTGTFVPATVPATGDSTPNGEYQYAFAMSNTEATEANFTSNAARMCSFKDNGGCSIHNTMAGAACYWLRTPRPSYPLFASWLTHDGELNPSVNTNKVTSSLAMRPACWIETK